MSYIDIICYKSKFSHVAHFWLLIKNIIVNLIKSQCLVISGKFVCVCHCDAFKNQASFVDCYMQNLRKKRPKFRIWGRTVFFLKWKTNSPCRIVAKENWNTNKPTRDKVLVGRRGNDQRNYAHWQSKKAKKTTTKRSLELNSRSTKQKTTRKLTGDTTTNKNSNIYKSAINMKFLSWRSRDSCWAQER